MIDIGIDYYPEHWDVALWEEDADRMARLGVKVVRMGEFAWGVMEPREGEYCFEWLDQAIELFAKRGMKVILGTPTNCPPVWLYTDYPDTVLWGRDGKPSPLGIRGNRCLVSPSFRHFTEKIVSRMARRYAGRPEVFGWQIDNELEGLHCTCPSCRRAFQDYVKEKYGTVEAMNRAWGNDVWSGQFSRFEEAFVQLDPGCREEWYNPAFYLDYQRFVAQTVTDFVNFQADIIRRYDPQAVITTNCYFCRYLPDFHREYEKLDVVSYDNYPPIRIPEEPEHRQSNALNLAIMRGIKRKPFWIMEQLGGPTGCWGPQSPAMEPGMLEGYALQAVAQGADFISFFRWRTAKSGAEMFCHGLLDHSNRDNRRLRELEGLCRRLEALPELGESRVESKAAILFSAEQEWSLGNQRQGESFDFWKQLRLLQNACLNLGVNVDIIHETASLEGYRVVMAPSLFITRPAVAKALEDFARGGGTVIVTCRSGVKDENGNCIAFQQLPTLLRELCGCYVEEYDPVGYRSQPIRGASEKSYTAADWCDVLEPERAEAWAVYDSRFYKGAAAVTKNGFGDGKAYYIGTVGDMELYRDLLAEAFREQGLETAENIPWGVEISYRTGPEKQWRFVFNNTMQEQHFRLAGEEIRLIPLEMRID